MQSQPLAKHPPFSEMTRQDLLAFAAAMRRRLETMLDLKRQENFGRPSFAHERAAEQCLLEDALQFFGALTGDLLESETQKLQALALPAPGGQLI